MIAAIRSWWERARQARAKRTYVNECLARMVRGRAEIGLPPLTREQRADYRIGLMRHSPSRMTDGRTEWK